MEPFCMTTTQEHRLSSQELNTALAEALSTAPAPMSDGLQLPDSSSRGSCTCALHKQLDTRVFTRRHTHVTFLNNSGWLIICLTRCNKK